MNFNELRTAIIHHWFLNVTGGERVVEALCELFDKPDLFAIVAAPQALSPTLRNCNLVTSFVQSLPASISRHEYYAFLFPSAVELFDVSQYDLVISSDASTAKGVITRPETCHICYCHSPMRYAWNLFQEYLPKRSSLRRLMVALLMHYLRLWDHAASSRVDFFIANSQAVRARIRKYYRRDSRLIYPPCDVGQFQVSSRIDDYYLAVGRLVGYKRIDLAVEAFALSGRRLLVVGEGPAKSQLKAMAPSNVEFLGWIAQGELAELYKHCRALIFPGEEDFGIVSVEAQASGRPVVAYGKGGALETVNPGTTGLLFFDQSPQALNAAVEKLEAQMDEFDPKVMRANAERFSKERFLREFAEFTEACFNQHRAGVSPNAGDIAL